MLRDLIISQYCAVSSSLTYPLAETECSVHTRVQDLGKREQRISDVFQNLKVGL